MNKLDRLRAIDLLYQEQAAALTNERKQLVLDEILAHRQAILELDGTATDVVLDVTPADAARSAAYFAAHADLKARQVAWLDRQREHIDGDPFPSDLATVAPAARPAKPAPLLSPFEDGH